MGTLSLAWRPLAETSGDLEAAIASGEIDVPAGGGTAAEKKMLAQVAARPVASRTSATTGGDVSRFWVPVSGRVSAPRPPANYADAPMASGGGRAVPLGAQGPVVRVNRGGSTTRSEEHTSELQSLMRISYAVFCLKKKKKEQQTIT